MFLATSDDVDGLTGEYFVRLRPRPSSEESYDRQEQERLWEVSETLCAVA